MFAEQMRSKDSGASGAGLQCRIVEAFEPSKRPIDMASIDNPVVQIRGTWK